MVTEATPQLSATAGSARVTVAPQTPALLLTLIFVTLIVGRSVSVTVTVCVAVLLTFPWISVTVQFTIVVPTGKKLEG